MSNQLSVTHPSELQKMKLGRMKSLSANLVVGSFPMMAIAFSIIGGMPLWQLALLTSVLSLVIIPIMLFFSNGFAFDAILNELFGRTPQAEEIMALDKKATNKIFFLGSLPCWIRSIINPVKDPIEIVVDGKKCMVTHTRKGIFVSVEFPYAQTWDANMKAIDANYITPKAITR